MTSHRIRELREARGLSQELLGSKIGRSKSVISRLEDGSTRLDIEIANKIAKALGATIAEVLDIDSGMPAVPGGFSEPEVAPYTATLTADPLKRLETTHRYLVEVRSDGLSNLGIMRGDLALIDNSAEACKTVKPLAIVRAQYHPDPEKPSLAVPLLRQFVPPSLLITNSATNNARPIDVRTEDAQILGVLVSSHRRHS